MPLIQIANLLIDAVAFLIVLAIIMRFLLQASGADYYNPLSQSIVKISNPFLQPLYGLIPRFKQLDLAALIVAVGINMVVIYLKAALLGFNVGSVLLALNWAVIGILSFILYTYLISIIIMVVLSWVAPGNGSPVVNLLRQMVEPVMRPARKIVPDLGGLDLSPVVVLLALQVLLLLLQLFLFAPDPRVLSNIVIGL